MAHTGTSVSFPGIVIRTRDIVNGMNTIDGKKIWLQLGVDVERLFQEYDGTIEAAAIGGVTYDLDGSRDDQEVLEKLRKQPLSLGHLIATASEQFDNGFVGPLNASYTTCSIVCLKEFPRFIFSISQSRQPGWILSAIVDGSTFISSPGQRVLVANM